jgi:gluconolactonase
MKSFLQNFLLAGLAIVAITSVTHSSEILKTPPVLISDTFGFTEGPIWHAKHQKWLFTDIPMNKVYSLNLDGEVSVFDEDSGYANGLMIDANGNVWYARHDRQVSYRNEDGEEKIVAALYNGKKLNSPNDLVMAKDGTVWFTDPNFGIALEGFGPELAEDEQPVRGVYQIKNGEVFLRDGSLELPNGLAFSNDEKFLYVADSSNGQVYRFDVDGETLSNKTPFAKVESGQDVSPNADGIKVDKHGNLYVAGGPVGFAIFSPEGKQIEHFSVDSGFVSNLAIGGPNNDKLMVTAYSKLFIFDIK